ncbi:hypothetical protein DFW101_3020 [Solidesulfovibrio carbinoliphilus subsp. oakridgensis]|uniref:Uncharacterized protein n=1 Tax=Solidesulfovibrio carbinoliphilus subsp. oakridgensis TaxID=694327 RepID=G7Q763_9BACT|nr:hypothetical protein [Solidesulfovibrio carbinoliphilus]EHJ49020.1 hypothetical protein DFW101_3020 [Solidesulfovibrio carbinoliphilus subsp. oakridgensis]
METDRTSEPKAAPEDAGIAGLETVFADLEARLDALLEARLDAVETRRKEAERGALLARFAADNPDFTDLSAAGVLEAQKRGNPLLDDVGAYFAHHLAAAREAGDAALAKAREEAASQAEADALARFKAKRLAQTVTAAPTGAGRGRDGAPELAAPGQFGGINAVLAARLAARRQSAGI